MQRREFLVTAGAVAAAYPMRNAEFGMRNRGSTVSGAQEPSLSPEVFARRLDRARGELKARGLDLLIATPSTNYEYLTGYNPGRSERLIALRLPVVGAPAIVCPSFEVERIKRHSIVTELHGWEEQEDPHALVRETVRPLTPGSRGGTIALESSTTYQTFLELGRPGTPCEEMDRAARKVITAAGYGPFFTHRLGHGLGMDGHEPEYLVEGNKTRLEPGMVFTIEPGIYQLGRFGVRIEDDCVMTATGVEVLSQRAAKL